MSERKSCSPGSGHAPQQVSEFVLSSFSHLDAVPFEEQSFS